MNLPVTQKTLKDLQETLNSISSQLGGIKTMYPRDDAMLHLNIGRIEGIVKGLDWYCASEFPEQSEEQKIQIGFRGTTSENAEETEDNALL